MQTYAPYRATLVDGADLRRLGTLRPAIAVRDTLILWAQILAVWIVVAIWPHWWLVVFAIPAIGTRYYALYIIGHDGLHRRLFPDKARNDLWNDLMVLGPIGAITRINRGNHMLHHRTLATESDPDRYKYVAANKLDRLTVLMGLTALPYVWRAVTNVFLTNRTRAAAGTGGDGYRWRDLAIMLGWQVALIGGLTWAIGWWAYPVLWLLPVYTFTFAADIVRVFLEHSMPLPDAEADARMRLVTYVSNPVERRFFAPMNMNFHAAHHLWPHIPYYNLPEIDALMHRSPNRDDLLVWRPSYLGYLASYVLRLPWREAALAAR